MQRGNRLRGSVPPVSLAETYTNVGAAGDDLVAMGDTRGSAVPEVRRPDGTWEDLPHLPERGQFGIVLSVGETVMAAGRKCSGECESGPLRMFLLSADRSEWRRLDPASRVIAQWTDTL